MIFQRRACESQIVPIHTQDAVRAHLDAIAASPGFINASRMSRFLRYTVEMKLRGEEDQIKEFLIGREVFDRRGDYDPRIDPIVRVEARRLRQCLAKYYESQGRADTMRIEFPKGSYVPVIQQAAAEPVHERRRWLRPLLLLAPIPLVLTVWAVSLMMKRPPGTRPAIAVVPARWVWKETGELQASDEALAEAITGQLANQGRHVAIGWPLVARYRGGGGERDIRVLGRELGAELIWVVAVRRRSTGSRDRVTVFQLNAITGAKLAVNDYDLEGDLAELAASVARSAR